MTIIEQVVKRLFLSSEPVFDLNKVRFLKRIEDEFPDLVGFYNTSNVHPANFGSAKSNIRNAFMKVCFALKQAVRQYKAESHGKDQ